MRQFTKIVETTIIDDTGEEKTTRKTRHTLRNWQELSREEKEYQIEKNQEGIYEYYQDCNYESYKYELENLREDFRDISFEDIYLDSNSQGWWIDRVKDFKLHFDDIEIYDESLYIDYDMKIRQDIDYIEIYGSSYYGISDEKWSKIMSTKKYQNWIGKVQKRVDEWKNRVNEICYNLGHNEYNFPSLEEDSYIFDYYFEDIEFEDVEELSEKDDIYV